MSGTLPTPLADLGRTDDGHFAKPPRRLSGSEREGDIYFTAPRSVQLRLLAERGRHDEAPDPQPMLEAVRRSGEPRDDRAGAVGVRRAPAPRPGPA